jgi:hypothetical protein
VGTPSSDDASNLIKNLSIFTASVVSLSGAFQAWSSTRITQALEEAKRTQAFSSQILDQMDNLTGDNDTKGKVALVGLYVIAANDRDKLNIANIALQSGKDSLREAAAFLLRQECTDNLQVSTCKNALEMLQREQDLIVQDQIRNQDLNNVSSSGSGSEDPVVNVQVKASPVSMAIEEITTARIAQSDLQGWIYLGKADRSGNFKEDRTIDVQTKPQANDSVTTTTSVYLRDKGTIRSGSSLGIIPKGQILKVFEVNSTSLGGGLEAIWAKVTTQKSTLKTVP